MSACFHSPTFNRRLSCNFGILSILSIVSLNSLAVSRSSLIESSNQFQQQEAASNVLDCNQYLKDNNISEDLIQGDTSDEVEEKVKSQVNLSADCMNQQAYKSPSTTNFRHQQNANNHELATSIEPIYFERYPNSARAGLDANDRSANYPPNYDANPRNNPFTNPFYLFGAEAPQYQAKNLKLTEPTSDDNSNYVYNGSNVAMKIPFRDNELDIPPSLLKPFESSSQQNEQLNNSAEKFTLPLAKSAQKQFELSAIYGIKHDNSEEEVQKYKSNKESLLPTLKHPKQLINFDKVLSAKPQVNQQVKIAADLLNKLQEVNSARGERELSDSQMKKPDKNSKDQEKAKIKLGSKFLNDLYRSSILRRLRQKPSGSAPITANISNILKPGEVLLSEKKSEDNKQTDKEVATVNPSDIVGLLRKLKPLMVSENERPEAEKVDHENRAIDEDFELEREELEELKRQNKVNRVLPTSHLFGGSVGIVNETKIKPGDGNEAESDNDTESNDEDNEQENENDENNQDINNNSNKVEDLQFLKTLTDLGSKLGKEPHSRNRIHPIDGEFYELYGNNERKNRRNIASLNLGKPDSSTDNSNDNEKTVPPIEIEALVDHLMSSSRLATFGIQHTGVKVPKANNIYEDDHEPPSNDDEEEDDEEEDNNGDDDSDNNDTLPTPEIGGEKEAESSLSETKVLPTFDAVANMSDTWIPLDSVEVNNKQLLLNKDNKQETSLEPVKSGAKKHEKKKKKRKKRKKRRRKKRNKGKGDLVLIIGDKMLSKTDLIRLIRVLNRMASKKEASREREASRRLLRFLVKLALEEYRKNKKSNSNDSLNDPIREVLRSVLLGPVYGKEFEFKNGTIGEIQLKPLATGSLNEGETKRFLKKTYDGENEHNNNVNGKPLKKSLNDLSDDLELYFESDFFEDLADKRDNSSKKAAPQNIRIIKLKPDNKRLRKLKRASRLGYSLPVPIYGKQHIEAADEDDTDLDHIKLKKRPTNLKRSVLRRKPPPVVDDDEDVEEEPKWKASPRRRPLKRSRELKSEPIEDAADEEAEIDRDREREEAASQDPDPEPDEERQSRPSSIEGEEKIAFDNRLNNPRSPVRRRSQTIKSNPLKIKRVSISNLARDNDDSGEPDPSSVITGEFDANIESHDDPDSEPDKVPGAENLEVIEKPNRNKLVSKKQRKKRRQRVPGSTKRGNPVKEINKVDLDDRDEIPAPINGSGESLAREHVEITGDGQQTDDSLKKKSAQGTEIKPREVTKKVKKKSTQSVPSKKIEIKQQQQQQIGKGKGSKKKLVDAKNVQKQTNKGKIETPSTNNMKLDKDEKVKKRNVRHKSSVNPNKQTAEPTIQLVDGSNDSNSYLDPDEPASEEPEPTDSSEQNESGEPQDDDYFNEGTSYSKVCEDDGKCHVSVQSSSPKLSKAIKARDKPLIVKHLGNWVSNTGD